MALEESAGTLSALQCNFAFVEAVACKSDAHVSTLHLKISSAAGCLEHRQSAQQLGTHRYQLATHWHQLATRQALAALGLTLFLLLVHHDRHH